ncbi:hypothetical protein CPB83DRAFT_738721, partial [Crepidotus variabilis]
QRRRDATSVMAGSFDPRPERDILTSCLNNIGPYLEVEKNEQERQKKKAEKRLREKEKKRKSKEESKAAARRLGKAVAELSGNASMSASIASPSVQGEQVAASSTTKTFTRPTIHIPAMQRSVSITPPSSPRYLASTPGSTPGPSMSSTVSRTSSKRPRTPDDYDSDASIIYADDYEVRPRKRRVAVKKGWKGWVEGSPEPSAKLINLDAVPVLRERRTRSGKNFDAIGVGKEGWV